jgi:hypothetical protein
MSAESIQAWSALLSAIAWPAVALVALFALRNLIRIAISEGSRFHLKLDRLAEVAIEPAQGIRPPSGSSGETASHTPRDVDPKRHKQDTLPFDYFFLNHTSFFTAERQEEFRKRGGHQLDYYDIRIIVDSYYRGALASVIRVEYVLHEAYPQPIQIRTNATEKFPFERACRWRVCFGRKGVFKRSPRANPATALHHTLLSSGPRLQ